MEIEKNKIFFIPKALIPRFDARFSAKLLRIQIEHTQIQKVI